MGKELLAGENIGGNAGGYVEKERIVSEFAELAFFLILCGFQSLKRA